MSETARLSITALEPGRLGWLLVQFRSVIMERWKERVLDDPSVPNANRLSTPALEDHIPEVLDRLLRRLAIHPAAAWGEEVGREVGGSRAGVNHARERISEHYTLAEAMRELSHFRATLLDLCVANDVTLNPDESKLLHTTIDEMMATSADVLHKTVTSLYEQAMGVVAHDLRNPLSTIAMLAARLQQSTVETKAGDMLSRAVRIMERLVEDLLTHSSLEAGHFSIQAAEVDPREILKEIGENFRPLAERRRVELLVAALPGGDVRRVWCDHDRLMQALGNVVGNAIKFTPHGGHVRVELELLAERYVFRVSDTGPGVLPGHVEKLFRPFWQAPGNTRGGAGLGLAIARGVVEAHGGEIAIEPRAPPGATFTLSFPYEATPRASASFPVANEL